MFTRDFKIRYSELDRYGCLSLPALVNMLQDTSNAHSEFVGLGWQRMHELKRAWMLYSWQIFVDRYPGIGEDITVESRPYAFDGLFGSRCFGLKDSSGEYFAKANSLWFLYNMDTGHPAIGERRFAEAYGFDEPLPMEVAESRRIFLPERMEPLEPFAVRKNQLDTNFHVNNSRYIAMAEEYFPEEKRLRELRIEYRNAAKYGDRIHPEISDSEEWRYISLGNGQGKIYAALCVR